MARRNRYDEFYEDDIDDFYGFIDMHHHIVYGLDDGPKKPQNSIDMIDLAYQDKIKFIIATPHVYPGIEEFDRPLFEKRLEKLNIYCRRMNYDLRILSGSEIYYTNSAIPMLNDRSIPTLAHTSFVLIEWATDVSFEDVRRNVRSLSNAGYTPIIAHVERFSTMPSNFANLERLRDEFEIRIQVDCGAICGRTPFRIRHFVKKLLKRDLVDYLATDAHNIHERCANMLEAYYILCDEYGADYARDLMIYNQTEILKALKRT